MKEENIRRQRSKTRQPCELALKGPNLQGWPSGRERSGRLARPLGVEGEEETNAKLQSPPDQEVNPTQPRFPPPRGDTDPASQAFGFSNKVGNPALSMESPGCESPQPSLQV